MNELSATFSRFLVDEHGVTSLEYALVGVLIPVVCVAVLTLLGSRVHALYVPVCNAVSTAISGAPAC